MTFSFYLAHSIYHHGLLVHVLACLLLMTIFATKYHLQDTLHHMLSEVPSKGSFDVPLLKCPGFLHLKHVAPFEALPPPPPPPPLRPLGHAVTKA